MRGIRREKRRAQTHLALRKFFKTHVISKKNGSRAESSVLESAARRRVFPSGAFSHPYSSTVVSAHAFLSWKAVGQQLVSLARTISSRDSNSQTTDKNRQLKAHVCVVNLSISFEVEFLPKRKKTNIVETRVKVLPVSPCVCCLYLWPEKAILKKKTVLCLVKTFTRYQFGPRTYETRERKKEKKNLWNSWLHQDTWSTFSKRYGLWYRFVVSEWEVVWWLLLFFCPEGVFLLFLK